MRSYFCSGVLHKCPTSHAHAPSATCLMLGHMTAFAPNLTIVRLTAHHSALHRILPNLGSRSARHCFYPVPSIILISLVIPLCSTISRYQSHS